MSELFWNWSASEAVRRLSRGEVSPSELLASLRSRVDTVGAMVNALPTLCFERAEAFARRLEALPASARGCFAGLPWTIKDSTAVGGVRTTFGSRAYENYVPKTSDYVVDAIEAQGGVVFAKSNTPEFEAGAHTFNDVFGVTLNPWDLTRSAGGSSGGAAVAVATGMAFLSQGSDFACSVRYPAAFCNVVGLRPTPGIIPQGPTPLPSQVLSVMGPIARNVADVALALEGMARFDVRDPLSRPLCEASYSHAARSGDPPPRAAFSLTLGVAVVDPVVAEVVEGALARLVKAGLTVEQAHPTLAESDSAFRVLRAFQFAAQRREALLKHRDKLKPEVVWNIEAGLKLSAVDIAQADGNRGAVRREMLAFLDTHHVLITPTAPVEPFPVEQRFVDEINGRKLATYLDWLVLGSTISVCGCPAISIPCGRSPGGLPVGLQLIGKPYEEHMLLRAAAWCESVLGQSLQRPITPRV